MNEFQEHVKELQKQSREGKYGWWNLTEDAKKVGLELEVNPLTLRNVGPGFMAGYQALSWLMLGGVPTAAVSGIRAAEALLSGEGPVSEVNLP